MPRGRGRGARATVSAYDGGMRALAAPITVSVLSFAPLLGCSKREPVGEPVPVASSSASTPVAVSTRALPAVAVAPAPLASHVNPCPAKGPCRVLPLGDSITFGVGGSAGGYRVPLFRIAREKNKDISFVGRQQNGPPIVDGVAFPRGHEGYPGYTVEPCGGRSGLAPLVDGALLAGRPHVVLLMIGTNDVGAGCDLATSFGALERLVTTITRGAPEATLVVATLVPSQDEAFDARAAAYHAGIPKLVADHAARGQKVRFADMRAAFEGVPAYRSALLADVLHPNDAGYAVMAKTWAAAMGMAQ